MKYDGTGVFATGLFDFDYFFPLQCLVYILLGIWSRFKKFLATPKIFLKLRVYFTNQSKELRQFNTYKVHSNFNLEF